MGNKGKVFLIYPPSPVLNREDRCQQPTEDLLVIPPLPPTDLMYLAAIAESCGFEAKIKDYSQGGDFIKELKEFQPHFLVVNIATPTFISDMDWVRKAKEALPGLCTIVKGAPFLTYNANAIYENTFLDYVIIGEAEFTLRDILNGVPNNEILGICYRENFQAEKTEKRPFIENLDSLPFPARHLVNNSIYTRPDNGKVQAFSVLQHRFQVQKLEFVLLKTLLQKSKNVLKNIISGTSFSGLIFLTLTGNGPSTFATKLLKAD